MRAIELLGEKPAHQQMRPGHGPEGEIEIGRRLHLRRQSVRAADHEGDLLGGAIAPGGIAPGEAWGVEGLAPLVEGYQHGRAGGFGLAAAQRVEQQLAFAAHELRSGERPALLDLDQFEGRAQAAAIVLEEVPCRPGFQPADGDQKESHEGCRMVKVCSYASCDACPPAPTHRDLRRPEILDDGLRLRNRAVAQRQPHERARAL